MPKIAVIDDVEDNREFLYFILSDRYDVIRYGSGGEALSGISVERPDLVILDISLPDINGFDVLAEMRRDTSLSRTRVIAVTAHAMAGDREKCLAAGFDGYVSKPILDVDEFLNGIAKHLEDRVV